ncbi:hypothetical protein KRZ98_07385 [Sphingobium sp. AS12]|uniref:hypothetical protein n=1 Tax=Sphingobium sp. AS12 TaxID=2849495 RepID=UPI001C31B5FE|nr:hypothetical protein [Sphingobium sp. AS12]MBV2148106.1 hypothetical protein [Sphingobium sp. AS12]
MAKYMILALNGPKPGEEQEIQYNRWYDDVHLPELRAVDGIVGTRRFKALGDKAPWPYFAAYEVETDDLPAFLARMSAATTGYDPSFDREGSSSILAVEIKAL